jgi:hypothetical protein
MSYDVQELLQRQAQWQKSRQALSWPEKIRMAEKIRDSIVALRSTSKESVHDRPRGYLPTSPPE